MPESEPPSFLAYLPAAVWAGFLLYLGSRSGVPSIDSDLPLDKLAHLLLYGVLGVLAGRGWSRAARPARVVPLVLALAVGAADELNQVRLATRSAEVADWAVSALGILAGFGLATRRITNTGRGRE